VPRHLPILPRALRRAAWAAALVALTGPASAHAQTLDDELPPALRQQLDPIPENEPVVPIDPLRIIAGVAGGVSVRLVQNLQYQQERFAPSYAEAFGGIILPGRGAIRHGFTLGVGLNLSGDGSYSFGLDPGQQLILTPSYVIKVGIGHDQVPDLALLGHVGVPLALTPDFSPGAELGIGAAYMLLAGIGVYVDVSYSMFFGGDSRSGGVTVHPLLSGEVGLYIDYEVL